MKKFYLLCLVTGIAFTSEAQTEAQLRELDSARKFLATTDLVYPYIDSSPGYPGGDKKWSSYVSGSDVIQKAIEKAKEQHIPSGKYTVIVKFAVKPDGTVGEIKTTSKPVGYGLEEAAKQLVAESGKWIPAHIEGKYTKGYVQLPVNFSIAAYNQ
jgi:hypothetical protein